MKYRVCTFITILAAIFFTNVAIAQDSDSISDEFAAFKRKLQQAQQLQPVETNKPVPPTSPIGNSSASPIGGGNPLGRAAQLPVQQNSFNPNSVRISPSLQPNAQSMTMGSASQQAIMKRQEEQAKQQIFEQGLETLMPLEPYQIRMLFEEFRKHREASETPITEPEPKTEVKTVSMDPSAPPIEIKTAPGYVTTITILDSTGSPWAIQDVSWAGKFNVTGGDTGSHILRVVPESAHGQGNISIRLIDLITPITFSLKTGLDEVHYRFDARIPKKGPLAKTPLIDSSSLSSTVVGNDSRMVEFLEGTPPRKSQQLQLNGVDDRTKAWRSGKNIYLRTPLTLLSPSWDSSVSSADGMNVYSLGDSPVLLLSDQGRMVKAYVVSELGDIK